MAASKTEGDKPKTHTLTITNAGGALLKNICVGTGWYEGKPLTMPMRAAEVAENLSDHVPPHSDEDTVGATPEDRKAQAKANEEWAKAPLQISVTEKQREAVKECLRYFAKKGALSFTIHVRTLVRELGLDEE